MYHPWQRYKDPSLVDHGLSPSKSSVGVNWRDAGVLNGMEGSQERRIHQYRSLRMHRQPRSRINQPEQKTTATIHYQHMGMLGVTAGSHAKADPTRQQSQVRIPLPEARKARHG